jgi:phosphoribosyl-ATP pyrophosphohydrolase/phosphoribosyl-AMP cyclohydrolase
MIIPSIDLMDGKAVQLRQGREKVLERDDPLELAEEFGRFGEIAVIDLDAAMGIGSNTEVIRELCKRAECRPGGGIRSVERARELVSYGATKVIVGTTAFENDAINHAFLGEISSAVGRERLMIAVDALSQEIVTQAWKHQTGLDLFAVLPDLQRYASSFLFTCVEREGMLQGTDMETIRRLAEAAPDSSLTVAGGITTQEEVVALARMGLDAQLGMALYTGRLDLVECFIESLNWRSDLLPTVTCDQDGQILMLAYSNKESLRKTFETGSMWYFSRSRDKLWRKGETSGHVQTFVRMRADCDRDALLATVRQRGAACHLGSYSCFGDKRFTLQELSRVVEARLENPTPGSYTATLTPDLVREKLLEEANEVVEAEGRAHITHEAADVLYFLVALLARSGVELDEVMCELRRRRRS